MGSGEHPAVLGSRDMGRKQTTKATPRGPRSQPRASMPKLELRGTKQVTWHQYKVSMSSH